MTLRNNRVASWTVKTLLVLLSTTLLITCDQLIPTPSTSDDPADPAPTYTVTYNDNGADSGSVPTDSNNYEEGQTVTTKTNSGNLARSGYTFNNWNTKADGSGTARVANSTFSMGSANIALYAQWSASWSSQQIGTIEYDRGESIVTDSSGNVYVTGWTGGSLDSNASSGKDDLYLLKFNSVARKQWSQQIGTSTWDSGYDAAISSSGNLYLTGNSGGNFDGNTNAGDRDIILMKYNSSGSKQWSKQLGTAEKDYGWSLVTDNSENIYITGQTNGNLDSNSNSGEADIFLVKYNSSGSKQWTKQIGTSSDDYGIAIATDSSGDIYITGYTKGNLDGNSNSGGWDIFLIKYNTAGSKQWTKQIGSSSNDNATGIDIDSSGNIYITGYTTGSLDSNSHSGSDDIFLVKYNSIGSKQWSQQIGTSNSDQAMDVSVDSSDNIYITGYSAGEFDSNSNSGDYDVVLLKYNSSGSKQWTKQIGTSGKDYGHAVTTDTSGNIYVTGTTANNFDGNTSAGGYDIFLVKYDSDGNKQ